MAEVTNLQTQTELSAFAHRRITMKRFLRVTMLWILLLPGALFFLGAASNQAVLIANHDKFPVLLNQQKTDKASADGYGLIDDTHCLMTRQTHLNALADIFDFKEAIYSIGDLMMELAGWLSFLPFVWLALVINKLLQTDY
jgi:hypothetical protein